MSEPILVTDENLHQRIVNALRASGFNVLSIRETSPGMSDTEVLQVAAKANGVLITEDSDFGELVFSHRLPSIGIVYLRYTPSEVEAIIRSLLVVLRDHAVIGKFCTVTVNKIRTRELPSA